MPSKYAPLTAHLEARRTDEVPMTFTDIERVLGFGLPGSAQKHRAWWSNNGSNNVMTQAWLRAGYHSAEVDIEGGRLVFRRTRRDEGQADEGRRVAPSPAPERSHETVDHRLFGFLRGTARVLKGADLTRPADPEWAERIERRE